MTVERTPQQARQGKTLHRMRYVLGFSLFLAIGALAITYFAV